MCHGDVHVVFFTWAGTQLNAINVQYSNGFFDVARLHATRIAAALICDVTYVCERFRKLEQDIGTLDDCAAVIRTKSRTVVGNIEYTTPDNGGQIHVTLIDTAHMRVMQGLQIFSADDLISISRSEIRLSDIDGL